MSDDVPALTPQLFLLIGLCAVGSLAHAIPDDQDSIELACPQAPVSSAPTLVLRGCDSGVKNRQWRECTIDDLLTQCEQEEAQFRNRCIAKTTNKLVELDIIDGKEKGEIQLCADPSDSELGDIHHQNPGNK